MLRERSRTKEKDFKKKTVKFQEPEEEDFELDLEEAEEDANPKSAKKIEKSAKKSKTKEDKTESFVERKWNDYKDPKSSSNLKKGAFTVKELQILQKAIVDYATENELTEEELFDLIAKTNNDKYRSAWTQIAGNLPSRSVPSIHAVCKRKFNPNNYKGTWTEAEEDYLLKFVEERGREWERVGRELGRTAHNCKDKYKELGENNSSRRVKGVWTVKENIKLLKYVQRYSGVTFLDAELFNQTEEELTPPADYQRKRVSKHQPTFMEDASLHNILPFINMTEAKTLDWRGLPWTKIAAKVKTKSRDDCRNRWYCQIYNSIHEQDKFSRKESLKLIQQISSQEPSLEEDIDFNDVKNKRSVEENKHQWAKMKKLVDGRVSNSVEDTLSKLVKYFSAEKKEKSESSTRPLLELESQEKSVPLRTTDINRLSLLALYSKKN